TPRMKWPSHLITGCSIDWQVMTSGRSPPRPEVSSETRQQSLQRLLGCLTPEAVTQREGFQAGAGQQQIALQLEEALALPREADQIDGQASVTTTAEQIQHLAGQRIVVPDTDAPGLQRFAQGLPRRVGSAGLPDCAGLLEILQIAAQQVRGRQLALVTTEQQHLALAGPGNGDVEQVGAIEIGGSLARVPVDGEAEDHQIALLALKTIGCIHQQAELAQLLQRQGLADAQADAFDLIAKRRQHADAGFDGGVLVLLQVRRDQRQHPLHFRFIDTVASALPVDAQQLQAVAGLDA